MDWNCTITLAFFKIRLDQIEAVHVFSDLADLEYLEELKRDYRATWKSLVEKGVLEGEPCEIMEHQCRAFLNFLDHVRGTIDKFILTIEEENSQLNKGYRQGLTQAMEFTQKHNASLERKLAHDLADLENILDQNPWQHTSIIHALLDFDEELNAVDGEQSLSSMDTNTIEKLMNFTISEGEFYQELQDLMRSRVEEIEALLIRHEEESTFLAQGLDCAARGYFGTAYSCFSSISGDFGDIDYIPLELQLKDYQKGLKKLQGLQSECNETLSCVESMGYWPIPFSFLNQKKELEQQTADIQDNLNHCRSLMDPNEFGDFDHYEGKPGLEALELSLVDSQLALRKKTAQLTKKLTVHLAIGFVAFLLIASGIIWKWDSTRMGKLQESFPGRERFENDEDYASRMQEKYPGIQAGEEVTSYLASVRILKKHFPGRSRKESEEEYAARMQDQFPGLKPGEKVRDYEEAMELLNQDFPGRLREESDADYAARLQSKYPGIRAGQTVQIYQTTLKALQEDFPGRRGDENEEAYAVRMQDQFPGLKTGEKVSDYQKVMERLSQAFPGRLREESDVDYAARMQSQYPGIRAGETPGTYQEVMKRLHIGFPDRRRDESATDYSIRMQGTYPGIQTGQTVAEYKSAMQELVKKFPGRNPGEGEGSYATRMQTQYPGLKPGETILNYRFRSHLPFTIPELGLEMVPIQAGEFWMGSPTDERLRKSDEFHHKVQISKPFWMGKFEVTQSQWKAIMGTTVQELRPKDGDSVNRGTGDNFPMYNVSWWETINFCLKLNEREKSAQRLPSGHGYRLPTEAQWEYSCRAGTNTSYAYRSNALKHINMSRKTLEVGSYKPNPWGLHDMHGNVYEWCSDWYGPYNHKVVLSVDPSGPAKGVRRVLRGGSWGDQLQDCRSAGRKFTYPEVKRTVIGFRLCLSP